MFSLTVDVVCSLLVIGCKSRRNDRKYHHTYLHDYSMNNNDYYDDYEEWRHSLRSSIQYYIQQCDNYKCDTKRYEACDECVSGVPVFKGFERKKFQQYDYCISLIVADFNGNKQSYCGARSDQVDRITDLSPALVKSLLIQESGGSTQAWGHDPAQVNNPGSDWNDYKKKIGLKKPTRRNSGTLVVNLQAAVKYLCRKGFGKSGAPGHMNKYFDGWKTAIRRYKGETSFALNWKSVEVNYRNRIFKRAENCKLHVPIPLPKKFEKHPEKIMDWW
eukprot:74556_1